MNGSYAEFQRRCNTVDNKPLVSLIEGVGSHASSEDPMGLYASTKQLMALDTKYLQALCHIYSMDFYCLGLDKDVPVVCKGIVDKPSKRLAIVT